MTNIVNESLHDFEIQQFAEESGQMISEGIKEIHNENINEAVAMLAISTILAAPAFVKILASIIKKGAKFINWKGGEEGAEKLTKFAHKAEKWFMKPIAWTLKKIGVKDEEKRKKWTKGIFALIIVLLGVYSGVQAVSAYKAANLGTSSAETLLTALKATETGESLLAGVEAAGSAAARGTSVMQKAASAASVLFH